MSAASTFDLQAKDPSTKGATSDRKPAILGGTRIRSGEPKSWPVSDQREEHALEQVLQSGKWGRSGGERVSEFEQAYCKLATAKHCIATSSGTTALLTSLGALGIGPGDEVILSPYTFVATYNAVTFHYALPIFIDSDAASFQMDAAKLGPAITEQTRVILPVHCGGGVPDMDAILKVANGRGISVIEDACQAHLSEWRGRFVGNSGLAGCFSFQASKNLTAGEGGAIITNNDDFADRCYRFHNQSYGRPGSSGFRGDRGGNFRMTEFQGGLLLAQLTRLHDQAETREKNAAYLTSLLRQIPGIAPARLDEGCTRSSHHLYMFRYQAEHFAGLSRAKFIEALSREGFPCSTGYALAPLNTSPYVRALADNPHYRRVYGQSVMQQWVERNRCPVNEKLCAEAVWVWQTTLLGSRDDMDQIAEAIQRIQSHALDISKA